MVSRQMKRCSTSLIRETKIKATMRYTLTPLRIAIINNSTKSKCLQVCGVKGTLVYCWWEADGAANVENSVEVLQKINGIAS